MIFFIIIESTRSCLINKANGKHSNKWVKRHALLLLINFVRAQVSQAFCSEMALGFLLGDIFSFCKRSFCGQLGTRRRCLHLPRSSSCFPYDQLHYRSCLLDLTNNDHNIIWAHIFSLKWLKGFFCIGVVSWPSCDYFIGKNQNWRHETCLPSPVRTLAWEENCIFKFWCTLINPFLCFSQSMVNITWILYFL